MMKRYSNPEVLEVLAASGRRAAGFIAAVLMLAGFAGARPALAAKPVITQVAAGYSHSCALDDTGHVWCWGDNTYGQLGDGTTTDHRTPARIKGLRRVTQISAGKYFTCARLSSGRAKCWGDNGNGQLGDGTTTNRTTPVRVHQLQNVTQIATGNWHSCAVLTDGSAKCWGMNFSGQLGDGTKNGHTTPVRVHRLPKVVTQIGLGVFHSCAVLSTGRTKCWGWNGHGELGDGTTTDRTTPVRMHQLQNATQVSGGGNHSCAVMTNGRAKCAGENINGQIGDGTTTERLTPVRVHRLSNATQVGAGNDHSCAVLTDGRVKCWGWNNLGQLGIGKTSGHRTRPVWVDRLQNVSQIAVGGLHSCAALTSGRVKCWGWNGNGQLGDGTTINRRSPVRVLFPG